MLSRTAENLYWMARYVERAENVARLLHVSYRMSQLPGEESAEDQWRPALIIAGQRPVFMERYGEITAGNVIRFLALDPDNPSSIYSSMRSARENARAERSAVANEMFESLNTTWLEVRELTYARLMDMGFREFFEWVKERSHLFRGVTVGTMMHDVGFQFTRLGTFVERGDNTARLLDVKYHMLLPKGDRVEGAVDYYQWGAVLRSLAAFKAYRTIYRDGIKPLKVAEMLILRDDFPRSLHHCLGMVSAMLEELGPKLECTRQAGEMHAKLHYGRIEGILERGLHAFLTDFVEANARLGRQIEQDFLMTAS